MLLWNVRYQYFNPEFPDDTDTFWTFRIVAENNCPEEALALANNYFSSADLTMDGEPISQQDKEKFISFYDMNKGGKVHAISNELRDKCGTPKLEERD